MKAALLMDLFGYYTQHVSDVTDLCTFMATLVHIHLKSHACMWHIAL